MKRWLLFAGFFLLFAVEIARVYFIMPFPGSQKQQTIDFAFWLHNNIWWLRLAALVMIAYPLYEILLHSKRWKKGLAVSALGIYAVVFFFFNFRFQADKMFYQPQYKNMVAANSNKMPLEKLVVGVSINGEAKAYPVQLIGYHHQVRDTVGGTPVMVTYCTVCRTGRVYSPMVNGKPETFRLVGMDRFNAMFEDATTKSWWQQATGMAVSGPLKGTILPEIPSQQMSLASWLSAHPASLVMQPDTTFSKDYADLADYDKGTIKSGLEKRDSLSWKDKSWVIGIAQSGTAKAYDWNDLVTKRLIEDSLPQLPIVLFLEQDSVSFHVWNRRLDTTVLHFEIVENSDTFTDRNTGSKWNNHGLCIDGTFKGRQLQSVQAYQEFWHSWKTFHPTTKRYL
jgi:hypothetical protein